MENYFRNLSLLGLSVIAGTGPLPAAAPTYRAVYYETDQTGEAVGIVEVSPVSYTHLPDAPKPLAQMDELRSGGSYFSQNDLRMHFGLEQATKVDMVEIKWLSGQIDQLKDLDVNRLYVIQEGGKILKSEVLKPAGKTGA